MKPILLAMGGMYVDINCYDFPYRDGLFPNQEVVGEQYEVAPGGSALNFARVCAAIELAPVFVGKIGRDKIGQVLSELLTETGVTPAVVVSETESTFVGMNFIGQDESSIMTVVGTASRSLQFEEVEKKVQEYLPDIEYLYLGGVFKLKQLLPHLYALAEKAKQVGVKVVLDHGRITNSVTKEEQQLVRELLPLVDYYLPSKEEFLTLWQASKIEDAVTAVRKYSDAKIVIKDAENGAVGCDAAQPITVPSFKVEVLNTVGAGDSFNAGFLKAQHTGMSFEESLRFGCATAALKISQKNLPSLADINRLIK